MKSIDSLREMKDKLQTALKVRGPQTRRYQVPRLQMLMRSMCTNVVYFQTSEFGKYFYHFLNLFLVNFWPEGQLFNLGVSGSHLPESRPSQAAPKREAWVVWRRWNPSRAFLEVPSRFGGNLCIPEVAKGCFLEAIA